MGLVTRVAAAGAFGEELERLLGELHAKSRSVLKVSARALRRAAGRDFEKALESAEKTYVDELLALEDAREGIQAFLEKREPKWSHK